MHTANHTPQECQIKRERGAATSSAQFMEVDKEGLSAKDPCPEKRRERSKGYSRLPDTPFLDKETERERQPTNSWLRVVFSRSSA
mmetsp:Transcript_3669/g.6462  ORF Transcript_3669/g.6462 Transcript_3669/m.6462 type:complete len:85 (-) Transcript_3669:306-560(-)